MGSNVETVADIVKDMRDEFPPKYCSSKHCRVEVHQPVRSFADRIEAAHEREVSYLRRRLDVAEGALDKFVKSESTNHEWFKCYAKEALDSIRDNGVKA